jgi:small ligand-binding sensory domain FIST
MACLAAHATHPDAAMAARLALACLKAQWLGEPPTLGLVYLTDVLAPQADALLDELQQAWSGTQWVGAASVGVLADGAEYLDEPALALFICDLPPASFGLFSGAKPLGAGAAGDALLVHADPGLPELSELVVELAQRAAPGRLFGGLAASRTRPLQIAGAPLAGGLSGLRLRAAAGLRLGLTQGCQPLAAARRISATEGLLVLALDGEPALPCLLADLGLDPARPQAALPALRGTLLGLRSGSTPPRQGAGEALDDSVRVRPLIGLDLGRQALALGEAVAVGDELIPCQRHAQAAQRDLRRMATALRAEVEDEGRQIEGAIYISCAGRGGGHFGAPHAEAQLLRHALGEVPTVGFFAGGELLGERLYGYSGVLAVFTSG